eukprot:m.78271 g.78271  ORF g.78271 m.78271 type:complete len:962 (-) comp25098_c0_seq1:120-3005(-)
MAQVIKSGMIMKRSVGKNKLLGRSNWKARFLVLDYCYLTYYDKYWDVSLPEPDNHAKVHGQFKVCDIRAVENVDADAFADHSEVFQVVFEDTESAKGPNGEPCLRALYIEPKGGVASGADSDRNQWTASIRKTIAEVGDVTILQTKYCSGVAANGKLTCCQREPSDFMSDTQGCKIATRVNPSRTGELKNTLGKEDSGGDSQTQQQPQPPQRPNVGPRMSAPTQSVRPKMELPGTPVTQSFKERPQPTPIARQTSVPTLRHQQTPPPLPPGKSQPRPGIVSRTSVKANTSVTRMLEAEEWFVRNWTPSETSMKLMQLNEGAFFVRESQSKANAFTVDIRTNDADEPIVAKRVYLTEDGFFRFEGDSVTHASMRACLQNCSDYKITLVNDREKGRASESGRFRGAKFVSQNSVSSNSSKSPPPMPARKPPQRVVVNTSTTADEDEIYGEVRLQPGQYEEVDFAAVPDNTQQSSSGMATMKVREMVALTGTPNVDPDAEEFNGFQDNVRAKNKLWTHRPDVTPAVLASLDKSQIKRQEAIYELVYSEQAYIRDVNTFIDVYLKPIQAKRLMDEPFTNKLVTSALAIQAAGQSFLNDLEARQNESVVVECIADVLLKHVDVMSTRFYHYSDIALETREMLSEPPALVNFLNETRDKPSSRGLTMDAFSLTPVQRMVRYPLLVDEVLKKTDNDPTERAALSTAHNKWRASLNKCNSRLKEIEEWHNLKDVHGTLNYTKLTGSDPVWTPDHEYGFRSMVKRGMLDLCKLNETGKRITKRKGVEVMLLSDVFLFAKSMKNKQTGVIEYIVYKQAHRSLIECEQFRPRESKMDNMIEIQLISDSGTETIYFKAKDPITRDRWLEAFNPPKEEEDIYQAWECPQFKVIKDHTPSYDEVVDGLPLKRGQIVEVEKKGDVCMKGRLKNPPPFATFNTSGYFPASCVEEIESHRKKAREVKRIISQNSHKAR